MKIKNEVNNMFKKGLTGFQIKLIALFLMIFDHVHYFVKDNDKIQIKGNQKVQSS